MPIAKVQMPDGRIARIEVPEGTTQDQVIRFVNDNQANFDGAPAEAPTVNQPIQAETPVVTPSQPTGSELLIQQKNQDMPLTIMQQRAAAMGVDPQTSDRAVLTSDREIRLKQLQEENPFLFDIIQDLNPAEAAAIGFQQGLRTIARGAGKVAGQNLFPEVNDPALQKLQEASTAANIGKIAGEAAPFAAAAPLTGAAGTGLQITRGGTQIVPQIASTKGRALASGALSGAEGASIAAGQDKSGSEVALSALLGGTLGAGAEISIPVINRSARKVLDKLGFKGGRAIDDSGNLTQEAITTLRNEGVEVDEFLKETFENADIGDDARRAVFENLGITPTQAQVTRDKNLFSDQLEAFSQEGQVTQAIERQDRVLNDLVRKEVGSIGGVAERASQSVSDAIIDKAVQLDDKIVNIYRQAEEAAPNAKNVKFNNAARLLKTSAGSNDATGGVISALKGKMESMGVLNDWRASGRVSVQQAEELRKFANSLFDSSTSFGRGFIRDFKNSLDSDALEASGKDFFEQARQAKADFEEGLSTTSKSNFSKRKKSLVRDILEEKIPEDKIAERVVSRGSAYDAKSLVELRDYLTSGNEAQVAQGIESWNDIRSQAMKNIFDSAFKGPANREGVRQITRAGIESGIKKIGPQKFNVLFSPDERKFLTDILSVSYLREPPPGVKASPSGPAIRTLQSALSRLPYVGGEIANRLIDDVRKKATEKRVLDLVDMAERASKKNNEMFEKKLRNSKAGKALTASPLIAVPALAEEEE